MIENDKQVVYLLKNKVRISPNKMGFSDFNIVEYETKYPEIFYKKRNNVFWIILFLFLYPLFLWMVKQIMDHISMFYKYYYYAHNIYEKVPFPIVVITEIFLILFLLNFIVSLVICSVFELNTRAIVFFDDYFDIKPKFKFCFYLLRMTCIAKCRIEWSEIKSIVVNKNILFFNLINGMNIRINLRRLSNSETLIKHLEKKWGKIKYM